MLCEAGYNIIWGDFMAKTRSEINNAYAKKAYDDVRLQVPKGRKATVEALAAKHGQSVNGYINGLLRAAAGLTEAEWRSKKG